MDYVFLRIYLASELHRLRLENACQLPCFVLLEQQMMMFKHIL